MVTMLIAFFNSVIALSRLMFLIAESFSFEAFSNKICPHRLCAFALLSIS